MMKVMITGSSKFPVPAVKGGAVPNLIEELIQQQENEKKLDLTCCSLWDMKAVKESEKYNATSFIWAKIPKYIYAIDKVFTAVLKNVFRKKRLLSVGFIFQVLWFSVFLGKVLRDNRYDYVVFENSIPMLFALRLFGNRKRYEGKYYVHMHSVPRHYYGNAKIFSGSKGIIVISEYVGNAIISDNRLSVDANQIKLMYNCIDTEKIKPTSQSVSMNMRKKFNIDESKKVILFAGRLCKEKGIEEVLQMMSMLTIENAVLIVVGANFYNSGIISPYEEKLQQMTLLLKNKVLFTGYVDYEDMPIIYSMADVVVLPSMWEEPAGMTIIEAMACKRPVITTVSGGIPEYTGQNSCILLRRDEHIVENLCTAVEKVLNDESYANEIASCGFRQAVRFSKEYYYSQFIDILNGEL